MTDDKTPAHYAGTVQPIDLIQAHNMDFMQGNCIKYIARFRRKGGLKDLEKAKYYLELMIEKYEELYGDNPSR